ncbi:unnamed protein product [Rangifer tarandus platyrhynchus]|uniref:Uncharacterized protein n=1 Tax=Rangifer tarandus platyrhynchus TaxID=3082113 RepID=A0AC60A4Z4_RANTA
MGGWSATPGEKMKTVKANRQDQAGFDAELAAPDMGTSMQHQRGSTSCLLVTELRPEMGVPSSYVLFLSHQWGETTRAHRCSKGGIEPSPFPRGAYDQDGALQNGES